MIASNLAKTSTIVGAPGVSAEGSVKPVEGICCVGVVSVGSADLVGTTNATDGDAVFFGVTCLGSVVDGRGVSVRTIGVGDSGVSVGFAVLVLSSASGVFVTFGIL